MKPQRIILIRHGQSEANVDKEFYTMKPDYTMELTDKGLSQSFNVGKELRRICKEESVFFYVSPYWRTRRTFEQIAKSLEKEKITVKEDPRLREQEFGHLRRRNECEETYKERDEFGTFYFRMQNGESAADVYDRVSDFFGTLYRDFDKKNFPNNVCIVTHGITIRLFLMRWFHWTVEQFEECANPDNCQIITLHRGPKGKYFLQDELKKRKVLHDYQRPLRIS